LNNKNNDKNNNNKNNDNNINNNNNEASDNADEHQQLLQLKYKNYQLEQEIKEYKAKLNIKGIASDEKDAPQKPNKVVDKSFQEQIPVSDGHYKIPINIRNKSNMVKANQNFVANKGVINSVENFQIIPDAVVADNQNVLQQPALINGKSTSTTTTTPTSVLKERKKDNLAIPSNKSPSAATSTKSSKKLPKFVLPIPDIKNEDNEIAKEEDKDEKIVSLDETLNKPQNEDINEFENGAHEINDNDFNIEEKISRNHFDNLDQDKNIINNAAEEFDAHKPVDKKSLGNDEMDLEIINRPGNNMKDKLKDEIANDHGKEDTYNEEDLHIEQQEDDLGDSEC
jgi:hypothetical protein